MSYFKNIKNRRWRGVS